MTKIFTNSAVCLLSIFLFPGCAQRNKSATVPQAPLARLKDGNAHFATFNPAHPDEDSAWLRTMAKGQAPFAVVVSCSDSRVSPELVFDQGMGDLFVIRTAGNIISEVELGSIEYAVEHLGTKLIVVMGHENCGAIQAYASGETPTGHLRAIVDSLKNEQEIQSLSGGDNKTIDVLVRANILHGIHQLTSQSEIIREKVHQNELQIVGARYDLDNYKVEFINAQ